MRFNVEESRKLLQLAGIFFEADEDDQKMKQTINQNDTWAWASADGQYVPDEKLQEVAELFWCYGWAGILYWVSKERNGMRSEFADNNRYIDFVKMEEQIKSKFSDDERAYKKIPYIIGDYENKTKLL